MKMRQCTKCGFLEGGVVADRPCTNLTGKHRFKVLDNQVLGRALGATGGRPPTYATEEERRAARLATFTRSNNKRRQKKEEVESEKV